MDALRRLESFDPEVLKSRIKEALAKAGISTVDMLRDDRTVLMLSDAAYKKIPLLPFRAAIKATIGKKGFDRLVLEIRDMMIQAGSLDLSWFDRKYLKDLLSTVLSKSKSL
ncbi:MAG TPA: hypothetical protein VN285_12295 [Candidatus Deferrimicrobium sp.]|nr:hypothetical protein [Candidatus Deferrimicrobium sp.]